MFLAFQASRAWWGDAARMKPDISKSTRTEGLILLAYFGVYILYLFARPEGEVAHWFTLVVFPLAAIAFLRRSKTRAWSGALVSTGLCRPPTMSSVTLGVIVAVGLGWVQLHSRNGAAIREMFVSGKALWLLPTSFFLMLVTAATTEELFFRGLLQTRLQDLLRSRVGAIAVTAVLFSLYHVPYAYWKPGWGAAGDWFAATRAAFETGLPLGVILGTVFLLGRGSLAAPVLTHAMINALPGMVLVERILVPTG